MSFWKVYSLGPLFPPDPSSCINESVPRLLTTEKVSGKQVAHSANALQGLGSKLPSVVGIANKLKANLMSEANGGIPLCSVLPKLIS